MSYLTRALTSPSTYPRGPPAGFSIPGIGIPSGGINAMAGLAAMSIPGMSVAKKYTNLTDFNTGFVANRSITNVMGADIETTDEDDFFPESFLFAGKGKPTKTSEYGSYPLRSLFKVNAFLASERGRRLFGKCNHYDRVLDAFRFVGQHNVGSSEWQRSSTHERAITTVVAGRTRMPDLFRAQKSQFRMRKKGGTTNEGDYVFLLLVRCKKEDELKSLVDQAEALASGGSGASFSEQRAVDDTDISPYYWKYELCTTHNRTKPPVYLYSNDSGTDDDYIGYCQFIGRMGVVNGDRNFSADLCHNARSALIPTADYKQRIVTLPFVELWMATH